MTHRIFFSFCWSSRLQQELWFLCSFYCSTNLLQCKLITFPVILFPSISLSVNSLINITSRFGSICRSTSTSSSSVKVFLTVRPSTVLWTTSWPRTNFCWWVINGRIVFNTYSVSLICTIWVDDGIDFASFRLKKFRPKTELVSMQLLSSLLFPLTYST